MTEPAVQHAVRYAVVTTPAGATWWAFDATDHPIARGVADFATGPEAEAALASFQELGSRLRFVSQRLPGGWWQWRAWHRGHALAVSAENHASSGSARLAAQALRRDLVRG